MSNRIVRYIDKGAVAYAQAQEHHKRRVNWGSVLGWVSLACLVVAFWWWALFC